MYRRYGHSGRPKMLPTLLRLCLVAKLKTGRRSRSFPVGLIKSLKKPRNGSNDFRKELYVRTCLSDCLVHGRAMILIEQGIGCNGCRWAVLVMSLSAFLAESLLQQIQRWQCDGPRRLRIRRSALDKSSRSHAFGRTESRKKSLCPGLDPGEGHCGQFQGVCASHRTTNGNQIQEG